MSSSCVAPKQMRAESPVTSHRLLFFRRRCRRVLMCQPHLCLTPACAMEALPSCGAGGHDASLHYKLVLCHWQGERIRRVGALTCVVRCDLAGSVASRPPQACSPAWSLFAEHSLPRSVRYPPCSCSTCLAPCFATCSGLRPPCSVFVLLTPCYVIRSPCSLTLAVLRSMSGGNDSEGTPSTPPSSPGSVLRAQQTVYEQQVWATHGVRLRRTIECLSVRVVIYRTSVLPTPMH